MQLKPHLVSAGDKFGRLTVSGYSHMDRRHRRLYHAICECGKHVTIHGAAMRSGNTKSCGCWAADARKLTRLPNNVGVINQIILQYKRHARDRGLEFHLTNEAVALIISQPCHYCGDPGSNVKRTKNCLEGFRHNGIDRVDSSISYYFENVVPCCGACNRAKRDMSRSDFIAWAIRIADHQRAMALQWGGDIRKEQAA